MLRFLQHLSGSFLIKFLLVLIGLSFIGWEFGNGFSFSNNALLRVNSQTLSTQEFAQELESRLSELRGRLGAAYDPALIAQLNLVDLMLEEKVNALLLVDFAKRTGLSIANAAVADEVRKAPAFQDQLGTFNPALYQNALQTAGFTPTLFENAVKEDLLRNYARLPFLGISVTNAAEIARAASMQTETRDVRILRFTKKDVTPPQAPTKEDLLTIYEKAKPQFVTPEVRTFEGVTLSPTEFTQSLSASVTEVEAYYQENKQHFTSPEKRKVRHILLKTQAEAQMVAEKLNQGTPFAALAKQFSQDKASAKDGGSLGEILKTDVVPGFAEVAFALPVGQLSPTTSTPFGVHLIMVDSITPEKAEPLSAVKAEITKTLLEEKALSGIGNALDLMAEAIDHGAPLKEAANNAGLRSTTYKVNNFGEAQGTPVPELFLNLNDRIFTMPVNAPSEAVEVAKNIYAFIEVTNITPAAQKPFEDVEAELKTQYFDEVYERATLSLATQALTKRLSGQSFEGLVKEYKLQTPIETVVAIGRRTPLTTPLVTPTIREELFTLPQGAPLTRAVPTRLGAALYEVTKREEATPTTAATTQAQTQLTENQRNAIFSAFVQHLRADAKININQAHLKALKARVLPQGQ